MEHLQLFQFNIRQAGLDYETCHFIEGLTVYHALTTLYEKFPKCDVMKVFLIRDGAFLYESPLTIDI